MGHVRQKITAALKSKFGDDESFWPHSDLPSGDYTLVMFESLDEQGHFEFEAGSRFKTEFTSALAADKTTIALMTYGTKQMEEIGAAKYHAYSNGLPLLLLDSRVERSQREAHIKMKSIATIVEAETVLNEFKEQMHSCDRGGRMDTYNTSVLAFMKSIVNKKMREEYGDDPDSSESAQRHLLLWEAIEARKHERDKARRPLGRFAQEGMTPFEKDLIAATDVVMKYIGGEVEWDATMLMDIFHEGMKEIRTAHDWADFREKVAANWIKLLTCCFHKHTALNDFIERHRWCELRDKNRAAIGGRYHLHIVDKPSP